MAFGRKEASSFPQSLQGLLLGNLARDREVSGEGRPVCLKLRASDFGISYLGCEEFSSLENSNCVLKGSAPFLALQITMKNQDKKNGPAKHCNPKSSPGQREAGPEGAHGRPRQTAPGAEAEGSMSQAPGKTEGVCQLCFSSGQREEFLELALLLRPVFTQEGGTIE